ncbi:MAG: hypothetical protein HYU04_00985 [Candidatus Wildermuthbacteria bacterium]|nr:hypothetical protein [Candidatus Wildermuthbacteria bacterium]
MLTLSQYSEALLREALAWGYILPGRFTRDEYTEVNGGHLALALLTCEGPGKILLGKLGVTLETEVRDGSFLVLDAKRKLDQLSDARETAKSLKFSALGSFDFYSVTEEAERMGSDLIEPVHHILALAKRSGYISVPYNLLYEVLDFSGAVKSPESLELDLAKAREAQADLQGQESQWAPAVKALQQALALNQATLSRIRQECASMSSRIELLEKLQQTSSSAA